MLLGAVLGGLPAPRALAATTSVETRSAAEQAASLPLVVARLVVFPTFDRLTMKLLRSSKFAVHQEGVALSVQISNVGRVLLGATSGHSLINAAGGVGTLQAQLAPGASVKTSRVANLLVIDIYPAAPKSGSLALTTSGRPPAAGLPQQRRLTAAPPLRSATLPGAPSRRPSDPSAPTTASTASTLPVLQSSPPESPSASQQPIPRSQATGTAPAGEAAVSILPRSSELPQPAILVPLPAGTGAAAFSTAQEANIVFDQKIPLDLAGLKDDPTFGKVTERLYGNAMTLRVAIAPGACPHLIRRNEGWVVTLLPAAGCGISDQPITGRFHDGKLDLAADGPGHVVVLDDGTTGGRLLVGTQGTSGQRITSSHRAPEFTLLQSWQGVVVQAAADRLLMTTTPKGFTLSTGGPPALALSWPDPARVQWTSGRTMTRLFDLPDLPPAALHRRLGRALRDAASTPKLARYEARLRVAQAMLAQGLDVEAAAVLHTAQADDPAHTNDTQLLGLSAIASWMSATRGGAVGPPLGFDPALLGQSDEAILWRALLPPKPEDARSATAAVALTWPLVLAYPAALQKSILRPIADALSSPGGEKALAAFLQAEPDDSLNLYRALQLRNDGKKPESEALLAAVIGGHDRLARAAALERNVSFDLGEKKISPVEAADRLSAQLYAWRGADRELRLKRQIARLRAEGGAWRAAFATLREAEAEWPQHSGDIEQDEHSVLKDLLADDHASRLSAIDLVALTGEIANMLQKQHDTAGLDPVVVEKLLALDLPEQAEPVLRRLFEQSPAGNAKAALGLRLAATQEERGELEPAAAFLEGSSNDYLEPSLIARRALLHAKILNRLGKPAAALAALSGQSSLDASELRASILENQRDFAGAAAALKPLLASAPTDAARRGIVLRLARDESDAGDAKGLDELRRTESPHFATGSGAALFSVLTAQPISGASDLARSASELATIRKLPGQLKPGASL